MTSFVEALADIDAVGARADTTTRAVLALLVALRVCRCSRSAMDSFRADYLHHWEAVLHRALAAASRNDGAVREEVAHWLAPIRQAHLAGDPGFPGANLDEDFAAAAFYALDVYVTGDGASLRHAATRLVDAADLAADGDERSGVFQRELSVLRELADLARSARTPEELIMRGRSVIDA